MSDSTSGRTFFRLSSALVSQGYVRALQPGALRIYLILRYLAPFSDKDTPLVYPSNKKLAELSGYSERQIYKYTAELERFNLVKRSWRKGGKSGTANYYLVPLDVPLEDDASE